MVFHVHLNPYFESRAWPRWTAQLDEAPNAWDRVWATGTEAAELGETPPRFLAETMNPPEVPGLSLRHACVPFPHA